MGKRRKDARQKNKEKRNRALSTLTKQRGCIRCGRWELLARQVYYDTGELCSAVSCPNSYNDTIALDEDFEAEVLGSYAKSFYEYSEELNEKSEDTPASLTTSTST